MTKLRSLVLCVGVGLQAACNVPMDPSEEGASFAESEFAIDELEPGERSQGRELHGPNFPRLERVLFSGATMGTQPLYNLRLEKGGLAAEKQLYITGTTPSLTACASTSVGQARSCGFVSKGAGSCEPGTSVTLGGGACGTGACTGDAVVRVCMGTQPCEYGSAGMLTSGDDACGTLCPQVSFTCPATGTYNVLAGPYNTSQSWSVSLVPSAGMLGWQTLRGDGLEGAKVHGVDETGANVTVTLADIINANTQPVGSGPELWDPSGDTWLYRVQRRTASGGIQDICATSNGIPYAVPVGGLFSAAGVRTESSTEFTFGCDSAVIAKCYRWGYQPWKDAPNEWRMRYGHWSCTRMARADYCGDGQPHTENGTRIVPWDKYLPEVITKPVTTASDMSFEGGWSMYGAECLSHWRWQTMPAACASLTPPIPGPDGTIINRCLPGQKQPPGGGRCASLCDTPEEAQGVFGVRMFNMSVDPSAVSP